MMKDSDYIPEDFDPKEYEDFMRPLGKKSVSFLDKEERDRIDLLRSNIRLFERHGVKFDDEVKLGYITNYSTLESEKLWCEFATHGVKNAIGVLSTILSLLYKNLLEKLEAEDAVFGINAQEDETK
jgi:hypothetical protein